MPSRPVPLPQSGPNFGEPPDPVTVIANLRAFADARAKAMVEYASFEETKKLFANKKALPGLLVWLQTTIPQRLPEGVRRQVSRTQPRSPALGFFTRSILSRPRRGPRRASTQAPTLSPRRCSTGSASPDSGVRCGGSKVQSLRPADSGAEPYRAAPLRQRVLLRRPACGRRAHTAPTPWVQVTRTGPSKPRAPREDRETDSSALRRRSPRPLRDYPGPADRRERGKGPSRGLRAQAPSTHCIGRSSTRRPRTAPSRRTPTVAVVVVVEHVELIQLGLVRRQRRPK